MSKIYKSFKEFLEDRDPSDLACLDSVHEIDAISWAKEVWEARQEEIDDLKRQRDLWEKAANDWMAEYDKLREKYEGH